MGNRRKRTAATSASALMRKGAKQPLRDASGTAREVAKVSVPSHVNRRKRTAATSASALMRKGAKPPLRDASGTARKVAKVSVPYLKASTALRSSQLLELRRRYRWSTIQRKTSAGQSPFSVPVMAFVSMAAGLLVIAGAGVVCLV